MNLSNFRIKTPLFFILVFTMILTSQNSLAQTVLIDHHFTTLTLPAGITSNGTANPTKAADGVCSQGMIQVNSGGGYLQVDTSSNGLFTVNMKSTSSATRLLTVKYKKQGDPGYTTVTTNLAVSVAASFNLTTLYPALISPVPVSVRIEPNNGNIQIHDLYVESSNAASNLAEISTFNLPVQLGNTVINSAAGIIAINVPLGTVLNPVIPQSVVISAQATISPLANSAQNFTAPVVYTVTAQNLTTTKTWTVNVTEVASTAKEITAFKLANSQIGNAVINTAAGTIQVTMPNTVPINNIVPEIFTISANAAVNPGSNTAQNFTAPVVYTVTAQDNSTKAWTITAIQVDPNAVFTDYQAEHASFTGTVDNNHANYTGTGFINFLTVDNNIVFTVCQQQAGPQTAKFRYSLANDTYRKGNLYVNDVFVKLLDFPRTATYSEWFEEVAVVDLQAGMNNIKITWDTTDGPNLDKMMLSGAPCSSYTLQVNATNGGNVIISPSRTNNVYFDVETVTLLAQNMPSLVFTNWSGDLSGNTNPAAVAMTSDKTITANFNLIPTFTLNKSVTGIGAVVLNPPGGQYAQGTVVTLTAQPILGSVFTSWSGHLSGSNPVQQLTMDANKSVTAAFNSSININFENVIGFAAVPAQGMTTPTKGGQCAPDTLVITGPAQFNLLCESLYYRWQAYKNHVTTNGIKEAPLVIILKAGIYDGTQTLSTNGAKVFGNSMLDIPEQGQLSFIGESNVIFKIGINVKRAWDVLIRNISFQDYYDDGINIGYPETHHIWIDHCTFGHPTTRPADTEHPDGGCDVKNGASYITISWCKFQNSWKTGLVGHSDGNGGQDIGRLKVTFVNNYYRNTNSRNPRVRFGEVHVLNNLIEDVSLYGIAAANSAYVYAENNFYLNTTWPMYADRTVANFKLVYGNNTDNVFTSKTGNYPAVGLKQVGNAYDDSGLPVITAQINPAMLNPGGRSIKFDELNPGGVFNPSSYYAYTPFNAADVRTIIPLFAGADIATFTTNCAFGPLPVKLLSFDVNLVQNNGVARASWKTTNEQNTAGFDLEKSSDGINFFKVGYVVSFNSNGTHNYAFDDRNPLSGISYYRLKMLDADSKFTYSKTVAINNNKTRSSLVVYPSPAVDKITVEHEKAATGAVITIQSIDGRTISTDRILPGAVITNIPLAGMAGGSYLLVYRNGDETKVVKFMKR